MEYQLTQKNIDFVVSQYEKRYLERLDARYFSDKNSDMDLLVKYDHGYMDAVQEIFKLIGKKDLLDEKEAEVFRRWAIEHPDSAKK